MGYNTALVEWPSVQISDPVKQHLDKFFSIMDLNAPEAGDRLADEVFASDGVLVGHHPAKGTEELRKCRDDAWKVVETRRHQLLKVYVDSPMAEDLLVIGQVTVSLKSGKRQKGEFIARISLSDAQSNNPKIKLYKVWLDPSAMKDV